MHIRTALRVALAWSLALPATGLSVRMTPGAPAGAPSPADIVGRVAAARAATGVASADVELKLRVHKAATEPADCVFRGTLRVAQGHSTLQFRQRSAGSTCAAANNYAGRLFDSEEPLESFLARFVFTVADQKLVGDDHYYLIQGTARDPKGNPHALKAWIDDDREIIPQGTISYAWGDVDARQTYTRLNNAWALTRQVLYTPRFDALLEIDYRNLTFTHSLRLFRADSDPFVN